MKRAYEYVVLRCVPRVDREEFVNVGVVVHCQAHDFLDLAWECDAERLRALDPSVDVGMVRETLDFIAGVCGGDERGAAAADRSRTQRFGFVKAPRSTVVQPGPVHGGLTEDPAAELERLADRLVR